MIFSRSSGETTVRDAAPAIPPAMKYDDTSGLNHGSGGGLDRGADEGLGVGRVRWTADGSDVIAVGRVGIGEYMSWTNDQMKRRVRVERVPVRLEDTLDGQ
jgi:hypothetical protein